MARVRHVVDPSLDFPEASLDLGLDYLRARSTSWALRGVRSYSKFRSSIVEIAQGFARDVDPDSFSKLTVFFDLCAELATLFLSVSLHLSVSSNFGEGSASRQSIQRTSLVNVAHHHELNTL